MADKSYYSVLQYIHDLERGESLNIGVLLFCPQRNFLKAITTKSFSSVSKIFGKENYDNKRLKALARAFEERVQAESPKVASYENLLLFIRTRANHFLLTEPRPMKVIDPEKDLHALFTRLVEPIPHAALLVAEEAREDMKATFVRSITKRNLSPLVKKNYRVQAPILGEVTFPFAFKNGKINLVETAHFGGVEKKDLEKASIVSVRGDLLKGQYQLNLIADFTDHNEEQEHIQALLQRYQVRMITTQTLDQFVREIEQTAKPFEDQELY